MATIRNSIACVCGCIAECTDRDLRLGAVRLCVACGVTTVRVETRDGRRPWVAINEKDVALHRLHEASQGEETASHVGGSASDNFSARMRHITERVPASFGTGVRPERVYETPTSAELNAADGP